MRGAAGTDLRTSGRETACRCAIAGIGILLCAALYLFLRPLELRDGFMIGAPFGRDFANFWLGGRAALEGGAAVLTDIPAFNRLLADTFGLARPNVMVFSYPPHALPLLLPFGALPYLPALCLWTALSLAGLAGAAKLMREGRPWGRLAVLTCLSPASLVAVIWGHFGGLMALAVAFVVLRGERRPVIAGLCMAALSVKPQFALLTGLVLLAAGRWRWIPAAALGTAALVALSVALVGIEPWRGYIEVIVPFQSGLLTEFKPGMLNTVVSSYMGARTLGLPASAALAVQVAIGVPALIFAVLVLRRGDDPAGSLLAVALAITAALPYVNHYDLAVAAPALTALAFGRGGKPIVLTCLVMLWLVPPFALFSNVAGLPLTPVLVAGALLAWAVDRRQVLAPPTAAVA